MSKYTITPWRGQRDLLQVRKQLYRLDEDDTDSRSHAVGRVMAWKLRGNLPHAVESTALLVDAILHHNPNNNSIFSIRAVYSAAFCRFVTGFCDIGRNKERTLEPSSMLEIARQIDMPVEFVALRHEATHEELPGVQRLVTATHEALDWLWKVYWSRLEEPEDIEAVKAALPALKAEATTLLRNHRRSRRDALRSKMQQSAEQAAATASVCDECVKLCNGSQVRAEALAAVMAEERLIMPSNRELGSPLDGAYLIWDEPLEKMAQQLRGFVQAFAMTLVESITNPTLMEQSSDTDKEGLVMWLLHTLENKAMYVRGEHERQELWRDVMKHCCLHPGFWTERIGREMLRKGQSDFGDDWQDLFEASLLTTSVNTTEGGMIAKDTAPQSHLSEDVEMQDQKRYAVSGWRRALVPVAAPIGVAQ